MRPFGQNLHPAHAVIIFPIQNLKISLTRSSPSDSPRIRPQTFVCICQVYGIKILRHSAFYTIFYQEDFPVLLKAPVSVAFIGDVDFIIEVNPTLKNISRIFLPRSVIPVSSLRVGITSWFILLFKSLYIYSRFKICLAVEDNCLFLLQNFMISSSFHLVRRNLRRRPDHYVVDSSVPLDETTRGS